MVSALSPLKAKAAFMFSSARTSGRLVMTSDAGSFGVAAGAPVLDSTTAAASVPNEMKFAPTNSPKELDLTTPESAPSETAIIRKNVSQKQPQVKVGPIHFCFIVHGHKGKANDLWYLHQTVRDKAKEHDAFFHVESSEKCVVGANLAASKGSSKNGSVKSDSASNAGNESPLRRNKRDRLSHHLKFTKKQPESSSDLNDHENEHSSNGICSGIQLSAEDTDGPKQSASTVSFIVHNASCNEGKTHDGVVNGGERLADEILQVIRHEVDKKKQLLDNTKFDGDEPIDVTISTIGNSLGGLYTRYAVARLAEIANESSSECNTAYVTSTKPNDYYCIMDGKTPIRIHLNVFCTTASPHLGCSGHTYFPIPRAAETGIAYGLGETGRDLFRLNDLLHNMATSPRFLEPLARFRKRIAYANAFGTDFVVPTTTAAFLDKDSDSLHYFDEYFEEACIADNQQEVIDTTTPNEVPIDVKKNSAATCPAGELGLLVATFHTRRMALGDAIKTGITANDLTIMASTLDSLGWKKVFVDMRKEIPLALSIPTSSSAQSCPVQQLKSQQAVESRQLAKAVSGNPSKSTISLPLGHNAICAMSRGKVTSAMNDGGKPVMDSLAVEMMNDISSWLI